MYKLHKFFILMFAIFFTGVATAQEEAKGGLNFAPVEIYVCNFNEGKGQADLDKVIVSWNKWMDTTGKEPYSAWIYTADYNSPAYSFDVAWMGAWPDGNAMGRLSDTYMTSGGGVAKQFDEVITCAAHSNWASVKMREGGVSEVRKNTVMQFSDCTLGEGSSLPTSMEAVRDINAYQAEQGSVASQWIFFPVFGADTDYHFKTVTVHPNNAALGADYERYGNGGGFMKAAEIIGDKFKCGNSRVYRSTKVR